MILDNLSRVLKTQNWLAAGIMIGFQIQAWSENRADRIRAEQPP